MTGCSRPVLVIDDERDIREAIRDLLEAWSYSVLEADNGRTALDLIERSCIAPCLVLLDLFMPIMDGLEFLAELANRPHLADLPILVTTSLPDRAPPGRAVLAKPLDVDALLAIVGRHCGKTALESAPL